MRNVLATATVVFVCVIVVLTSGQALRAQQSPPASAPAAQAAPGGNTQEAATAELQKAVQNPVANLISVPVQNNLISVSGHMIAPKTF